MRSQVSLTAVGMLGLAACTGSGSRDPVTKAAQKTAAARTARISITVEAASKPGQKLKMADSLVHGSGSLDFVHGTGHITFVRSSAAPSKSEQRWDEVLNGGVVYIDDPSDHSLPAGKTWTRFDLSRGRAVDQARIGSTRILRILEHSTAPATKLGPGSVGGVATMRYRKSLGRGDPPIEVWIGDDGRIRQFRFTETESAFRQSRQWITTTGHFYDFGTPVHITLPPAGKVNTVTTGGK